MITRAGAVAAAVAGLVAGIVGVAPAATLHVPTEYATIQAAVDAAVPGDSVLVAPGLYVSATTRAVFIGGVGAITVTSAIILKDGVSVVSEGGSAVTTIDTSGATVSGSGWVVVGGVLSSDLTRVEGFTLVGPAGWNAIHIQDSVVATVTIEDCVVSDFDAGPFDISGGITASQVDLVVRGCLFRSCIGVLGGAVSNFNGGTTIEDTRFELCTASSDGGAVHIEADLSCPPGGGPVAVLRCEFVSNTSGGSGAGLNIVDNGKIADRVIEDCVFSGNVAGGSGGAARVIGPLGPTSVARCVFVANSSTGTNKQGGGLDASGGGATFAVRENTFYGCTQANTFIGGAALATASGGSYAFTHNVFAACSGFSAVGIRSGATLVENSCNVYWQNSVGNTSGFSMDATDREVDPLFCDPLSDDFTVAANSPCLDANSPTCAQVGAFGQGCGPVSIESTSWGSVKARYSGGRR